MPPMGGYIPIPEFETEKMYKIDGYRVWFNPDEHFIMSMLVQQPVIANNVDARTWKYWSNENIVQCPQEITESSYLWPEFTDDCNVLPEFTDDSTDDSQIWSNVATLDQIWESSVESYVNSGKTLQSSSSSAKGQRYEDSVISLGH
ncbi:hypothetical protein P8452_46874 [Trifolium repens]|nr:hypothetical protein P8452_46874 [Trifolium repens]